MQVSSAVGRSVSRFLILAPIVPPLTVCVQADPVSIVVLPKGRGWAVTDETPLGRDSAAWNGNGSRPRDGERR